jgi:hypothetical protein
MPLVSIRKTIIQTGHGTNDGTPACQHEIHARRTEMEEDRRNSGKMDANSKTNREEMLAKIDASMKYNQEQILATMIAWETEDKAQREMEAKTEAIRAKMNVNLTKMTARMDAWLTDTNDNPEETMACQEKTEECLEEEEPTSEDMEPEVAHEEVPVEDAARMPVREPRNRRRDQRNLATERHQKKQQKWTQSKSGC